MSNPTLPSATPTAPNAFQNTPTLSQIQQKVRRLTRSPSTQQLTDPDLNNYINTFVIYDFPEHLRTFNLKTTFNFFTNPGQDIYNTDEISFGGAINNPLYNFQNLYLSVSDPVYIAGYQCLYSQNRNQFYGIYPLLNSISQTGITGNGTTGPFTGFINTNQAFIPSPPNNFSQRISLLQNNVTFSAHAFIAPFQFEGMNLVDVPVVDPNTGFKMNVGNLYDPNGGLYEQALMNPPTTIFSAPFAPGTGVINYLTGFYTINFSNVTAFGQPITSQTVPMALSRPEAMCFFSNQFILRPVPIASFRVNFEVFQRPTALLATNQTPELEEYWQYIAYGAAKKIFEDRMDLDSVQKIMPEYMMQEALCLRRTIVQNTTQRTATIYEQQNRDGYNGWGNSFGGPY